MPWIIYQPTITASTSTNLNLNLYSNYTTTNTNQIINYTQIYYPQIYYPQTYLTNPFDNPLNNQISYYQIPQEEIMREQPILPEPRRVEPQARTPLIESAEKAKALLLTFLDENQRKTFLENGWFVIEGGKSKSKYRINTHSFTANVQREHDNIRFCAHCGSDLPLYDHIIAQKLMLENDEDAFLAIANRS
jgi:hypothetical protein